MYLNPFHIVSVSEVNERARIEMITGKSFYLDEAVDEALDRIRVTRSGWAPSPS